MSTQNDADRVRDAARSLGRKFDAIAFELFSEERARAALKELGRRGGLARAAAQRREKAMSTWQAPEYFFR